MTIEDVRLLLWQQMPEEELEEQIRELARVYGWMRYHPWRSKHSESGWPDDVLIRGSDMIIAECKREGTRYRPTTVQQQWLGALRQVRNIHVDFWQPHDQDRITALLQRGLNTLTRDETTRQ
ncbi:MAG: hypothetical protein H0X24_24825 [Ktedonobacterales bacterium]|nr:hypothetical protein [Ktedonobacterales bacterium]